MEELDRHLLQEVRRLGREAVEDTSGLVREKAMELEAVGGELSLSLVPVLVKLVAALQGQSHGLQKMGKPVTADLGDIRGAGKAAGRTTGSTAGR